MTRNLMLNFLGGMAIAAAFLGLALAADGRQDAGSGMAAARPGCRTVIGIAAKDNDAPAPVFETDHSRCRLVA